MSATAKAKAARVAARLEHMALEAQDNRALIEEVQRRGFLVVKDERAERQVKLDMPRTGRIRLAVSSDTHLGSKYQQLTHWRRFTEDARKWGAERAIHLGDVVDGSQMRKGHEYEVFKHGCDAQGRYAAEMMPALMNGAGKELPTDILGGNHDEDFWKGAGANVIEAITSRRPAINFLGAPQATIHIGTVRLYLLHPKGGVSYARSYRLQKLVEQFAPDEKPHVVLVGHYHVPVYVPGYRNVEAAIAPCFQSQTPYLKTLGLAPVVGGMFIELAWSKRGLEDFRLEYRLFHTHLGQDYP